MSEGPLVIHSKRTIDFCRCGEKAVRLFRGRGYCDRCWGEEIQMPSMPDVREAERIAKAQRIAAGRYLRVDETKIASPKDMMLLHRVKAAAAERSGTFDVMLGDRVVNRLFNDGALYFDRPGQ
jgi:hypothetical protein